MIHLIERFHTMDKVIRVGIAIVVALGLGFVWAWIIPWAAVAAVVSLAVGLCLGHLAVRDGAPNVLPTYRVEVRPDDYKRERRDTLYLNGWKPTPRWDDPDIKHLRGVPWYEAEIPPKRHECWPQTDAWIGLDQTQRCACGAIRAPRFGGMWLDRNSRKPKVDA